MINIVVPMAGLGSRFVGLEAAPKPLIEVEPGKLMIDYVIGYLSLPEPHRFIFVCRQEHVDRFNLDRLLPSKTSAAEIVSTRILTRGPAASALLAAGSIDSTDELIVAYCDCYLEVDFTVSLATFRSRGADGGMLLYPSDSPNDSYAITNSDGWVLRVAEKQVISCEATAGLYYFRQGRDYVSAARSMIAEAPSDGPEHFVSTVYNALIGRGQKVLSIPIKRTERIEMGTPADLAEARAWLRASKMTSAAGGGR